ncbi:PIN domain-containing protein ['Massilia aquatica' Lu et al. 2020]|uniref:PIN domain-containing protein n=1 Tax=Pseudoduganella aquatica TaxID=2660641 RepID=A0A7X4HA40_9BURK|nr:PIN domain-containing protein [Pseudoduganella aquatica]
MAGYHRYTAVLDACVLYPAALRDLLLSLAADGVFRARWSDRIHEEWTHSLLAKRPDLQYAKLRRTIELMNEAVEDATISGFEPLIPALALPDEGDRHVLAAAIVGHADAIVTFNLKDFPESAVAQHGVEVLHPDDFLVVQHSLAPGVVLGIVKAMRKRLGKPPRTAAEFISALEASGLPQFCALLRQAQNLI